MLMTELVPKRWISAAIAFLMICDMSFNQLVPALYFGWISIDWRWLFYAYIIGLYTLLPLYMLWLPESPALFYERGEFDKAKKVVQRIA